MGFELSLQDLVKKDVVVIWGTKGLQGETLNKESRALCTVSVVREHGRACFSRTRELVLQGSRKSIGR